MSLGVCRRAHVRGGRPALVPHRPRCIAARVNVLELLPILERVHRLPETIELIRRQFARLNQSLEWFTHKLLTLSHVFEDFTPESEESAVDPNRRLTDVFNGRDAPSVRNGNQMVAQVWLDADKARHGVLAAKVRQMVGQH